MVHTTGKRAHYGDRMNQVPTKRRRRKQYGKADNVSRNGAAGTICLTACDGLTSSSPSSDFLKEPQLTQFADAGLSTISPTQLSQSISDEIDRLRRCKQLSSSMRAVERMQDSESGSSDMDVEWQPQRPDSSEEVLFTFKDVQLICERVLKEHEDEMREKYDAVLNNKLAEQYVCCLKFTHEQLSSFNSIGAAPSLSQ
uniref:Akirin n=1 Tax=Glossina pallidipes TaxID=7398 RepID=A0A1B0A1V1_GLOPL